MAGGTGFYVQSVSIEPEDTPVVLPSKILYRRPCLLKYQMAIGWLRPEMSYRHATSHKRGTSYQPSCQHFAAGRALQRWLNLLLHLCLLLTASIGIWNIPG